MDANTPWLSISPLMLPHKIHPPLLMDAFQYGIVTHIVLGMEVMDQMAMATSTTEITAQTTTAFVTQPQVHQFAASVASLASPFRSRPFVGWRPCGTYNRSGESPRGGGEERRAVLEALAPGRWRRSIVLGLSRFPVCVTSTVCL